VKTLVATRREALAALAALGATSSLSAPGMARTIANTRNNDVEYGQDTLPVGVRSRRVDNNNGVTMHVLEAGFETRERPCVVLLHGFPELGYCWRNQLLPLARAGFHVVAPDLRGYGLSASKAVSFDDDLLPYSMLNRVGDILGLIRALGHEKVAAIVGHDWGGPTAQWCARLRPDVFESVVSMSPPFLGGPVLPLDTAAIRGTPAAEDDIEKELAALPRPRKHYARYSATREANKDLWHASQGVHDLLREYYYFKSADWEGNKPFPLKAWTALELSKMPTYYIMDLNMGIAATMAEHQPAPAQIAACRWMTEADLQVYSREFARTGFQGGLNYYRVEFDSGLDGELNAFAGRTIDVPAAYIGGDREWAVYQSPGGAFESMHSVCTRLISVNLVPGAGHSLVEERPEQVNQLLLSFIRQAQKIA
jgi:pimeloyl-ACP methyl ester carboxylesterase